MGDLGTWPLDADGSTPLILPGGDYVIRLRFKNIYNDIVVENITAVGHLLGPELCFLNSKCSFLLDTGTA